MSGNAIIGSLRVMLGMDSAAFEKGATAAEKRLKSFNRSIQSTAKGLKRGGKTLSIGLTAPIMALAYKSVAAMRTQEEAVKSVDAVLSTMGNTAGFTSKQLQDMASRMQDKSLFGDEQILRDVTSNLLTFGNISGDVFKRTQRLSLDLSQQLHQDLKSSTIMLGKALNAPAKGLAALTHVGISFTAEQNDQIKTMAKAGDVAGAQALMLKALEHQYGKVAQTAAKTDSGKIFQAQMAIGDAMEKVGAIILPILADMAVYVKRAAKAFQTLPAPTRTVIVVVGLLAAAMGPLLIVLGLVASGIGALAPVIGIFGGALALLTGPITLTIAGIALLAAGAYEIYRNWGGISAWFGHMWDAVANAASDAWAAIKTGAGVAWNFVTAKASGAVQWIEDAWGRIADWFSGLWTRIEGVFADGWKAVIDGARAIPGQMMQIGSDIINGLGDGIRNAGQGALDLGSWIGHKIVAGAKGALRINSPSKAFHEIGQFIMQGLGMGMGDGMSGPIAAMDKTTGGLTDAGRKAAEFADRANRKFQGLGKTLAGLIDGSTSLSRIFGSQLLNMGSQGVSGGIDAFGKEVAGKGAGGGLLSGLMHGLSGFKTGGSFTVPGAGALDSKLVAFRASPGEQVSVHTPAQMATTGGAAAHMTFNISTPDAQSFRRSRVQIAGDMQRALRAAGRA